MKGDVLSAAQWKALRQMYRWGQHPWRKLARQRRTLRVLQDCGFTANDKTGEKWAITRAGLERIGVPMQP